MAPQNNNCARQFSVLISNSGEEYVCAESDNLLKGMEHLSRRGIPVGCRGGGCGVCKIRIAKGRVRSLKMSRQRVTHEEEAEGVVLACRAFPQSDIELGVLGKMSRSFDLHRFMARPPQGRVESLAAAQPCRSPTIREES
ncbi:ferredoxin [Thauera sinica]|nr:2Fe-2S iron-sulfur cluster-binding protein [Thauera sp. K11]ATE62730.1 ferredoxin [Thauera sp. K11]